MFEHKRGKEETFEFYNKRKKNELFSQTERGKVITKRNEIIKESLPSELSIALDKLIRKTVDVKIRKKQNTQAIEREKQLIMEFEPTPAPAEPIVKKEPTKPKELTNEEIWALNLPRQERWIKIHLSERKKYFEKHGKDRKSLNETRKTNKIVSDLEQKNNKNKGLRR